MAGFTNGFDVIDRSSKKLLQSFGLAIDDELPVLSESLAAAVQTEPDCPVQGEVGRARLQRCLLKWIKECILAYDGLDDSATASIRLRLSTELPEACLMTVVCRLRSALTDLLERHQNDRIACLELMRTLDRAIIDEVRWLIRAYRQTLLDRLATSEYLASVGQLTSAIGHELRNPLSTLEASLFLAEQKLCAEPAPNRDALRQLNKARATLQTCASIITGLLDLSRNHKPQRVCFGLNRLVDEVVDAAGLPAEISVAIDLGPDLIAYANPEQVKQILLNLLGNAADALSGPGNIEIHGHAKGDTVVVSVADDGPGISDEHRSRIFEVLFTTKPSGHGLGLSVSRRLAEAQGGELLLDRTERGACFVLRLPSTDRPRS